MATNQYFKPMGNPSRDKFLEGMLVQYIQANGLDMLYLPREILEDDEVYEEAKVELFDSAIELEVMIEDMMNFNGDGHAFMVGFSMEDSATFVVSKKRFLVETGKQRPAENDLFYIREADQFYQVDKILEDEKWREWGQNIVWRLKLTRFRYGHEEFETGDLDIDGVEDLVDGPEPIGGWDNTVVEPHVDTSGEAVEDEVSTNPNFNIDFGQENR